VTDEPPVDDVDEPVAVEAGDADAEPGGAPTGTPLLARLFKSEGGGDLSDDEVRERLRTLDPQERKWGFYAVAALAFYAAVAFVPHLFGNTPEVLVEPLVKKHCLFTLVHKVCTRRVVYTPSDFLWPSAVSISGLIPLLAIGSVFAFGIWRSKRTLTIFMALLTGFVGGLVGIALFVYSGWLVIRSFRLSRYGTTNAKEVRQASLDRAAARREARRDAKRAPSTPSGAPPPRTGVAPSKRYTPSKSRVRRK
jgi:hypothetical protein